jgi:fructuronate reductase
MSRLHPSQLSDLPASVAQPRYARAQLEEGIVHLGIGAFQRAHFAVVNEAALHATQDLRWGVVGVSLRSPATRDSLEPQGSLYTLAVRGAAIDATGDSHTHTHTHTQPMISERPIRETLQVIGNLVRVLVAPEDPHVVLEAIANPLTRIVSLTVTEKGYHRQPATGDLQFDDVDIAHDLTHAAAPRTAIGFIVHGLELRRQRALAPVTLLSCDNLPANGDTLRALVLALAQRTSASLHDWIAGQCTFPNSMVDRIVPRTTDADRERVAQRLGVRDEWPLIAEPFMEWVIEDRFAAGRPAWQEGGARFVESAAPFERMKLRMVNGSHSALAYLGAVAGWNTVDQALAVPAMRRYLEKLMREEIAPTLCAPIAIDADGYRTRLLQRFANPALQHLTRQIAMDGSQKLPQRLLDTVRERLAAHESVDRLALAVAGWLHFLRGVDEAGNTYEIQDPLAGTLIEQVARADATGSVHDGAAMLAAFAPVFGDLGKEARFVSAVARHLLSLRQRGVHVTLESQP